VVVLCLLCWIGKKLDAPTLYYALIGFVEIIKVISFGIECYKKGAE